VRLRVAAPAAGLPGAGFWTDAQSARYDDGPRRVRGQQDFGHATDIGSLFIGPGPGAAALGADFPYYEGDASAAPGSRESYARAYQPVTGPGAAFRLSYDFGFTDTGMQPEGIAFCDEGVDEDLIGKGDVWGSPGWIYTAGTYGLENYLDRKVFSAGRNNAGAIPVEIIEPARMDRATFHRVFLRIVVPLTVPGLAAASIFLVITAWNELLYASLLSQDSQAQTIQVGIGKFLASYSANYPQAFAATVMAIAPTIIAYAFLSNRVITGMTAGSLK
jgi:hypothetical protein